MDLDVRAQLHRFGLARDSLNIALARRVGLSQIDLHALEHLEEAGPLTPTAFQGRLGLSSGAVTALVDRLEAAGWVERATNPADRRSVLVRLSPRAGRAGAAELGAYHRAVGRAAGRLSASERRVVAGFLAEVTRAAERSRR